MGRPLRVLMASAEVEPFASTGGLGRSVGGLASALKRQGVDVRVVMPKYRQLTTSVNGFSRLVPKMRIRSVNRFGEMAIFRDELPFDVPVYFIEKDKYFDRDYLYGPPGGAYDDNAERYCFFCLSVLEMFMQIGFFPDVIHCHDWHTGLIPVYLRMLFHNDPLYAPITTVFTLHDILHQGCFSREALGVTGLPDTVYSMEGIEFYGKVSFLKAGLVYADLLSTDSKRYSQEIQTAEYGHGFEHLLQMRESDLYGVINGVDYKHYDPRLDAFIAVNYTKDELAQKLDCKRDLLETCHFPYDRNFPLIGMIAPFDEEKGVELVIQALPTMMKFGVQFIFLNREPLRDNSYLSRLNELAAHYGQHIRCYSQYEQRLEHKILAGADILLAPSKSEPYGDLQMYSLKYGTIPVVRATGVLDDSILSFSSESGKGNGFKFTEYTAEALLATFEEALAVYHNPSLWELLQMNAMRADFSWVYSAKKYLDLYKVARGKAVLTPTAQSAAPR